MAPPVLHHTPSSPCSRGALLAASLLGVRVRVRHVDLRRGEHLAPEFLRLNPLHTVPTLQDGGFVVVDSNVIAVYLAEKYSTNEKAYPKDINERTIVNQLLFFHAGVLFRRIYDIAGPVVFSGVDIISEEKKAKVHEALEWLEGYLKPTGWLAGDHITIADALCVSTVTSYASIGFHLDKYPKVKTWVENCRKSIPDFDAVDTVGVEAFQAGLKSKLKPGQIDKN